MIPREASSRIVLVLVVGILFLSESIIAGRAMADEPQLRLNFIPFAIETYVPITMANIDEHGHRIWFLERNPFIPKLLATLKKTPARGQILRDGLRLKADFGGAAGVYFVDRNGTVLHDGSGAAFVLTKEQMKRLEREIQDFVGVVDVNATKRRSDWK